MRVLLELFRIIFIFGLLGGLGSILIADIYTLNAVTEKYAWFGSIAILLLLFVWYRNKLQFSGWYQGKKREKLSKSTTLMIICSSIGCFFLPFILGWLGK